MLMQQHIFTAKPGKSQAVLTKLKEFQQIYEGRGGLPWRLYVGRMDDNRNVVVWQVNIEREEDLIRLCPIVAGDPEYEAAYYRWFERFKPLIIDMKRELWDVR
ncbi:MAG: hypothetical protein ACE5KI_01540 [Dehalococcoidia bacterium]